MGSASPPGWHGKLPSLGDFASRRLDAGFIEPWDGWLAAGLMALRQAQPEGWLDDYLGSPSWRFLLMPGVLPGTGPGEAGSKPWAGVLMPSVDRVGRYFPLTVVLPLNEGPGSMQELTGVWQWLGRLDDLARDALHEDWSADRLEEELARMALPPLSALRDSEAEPPLAPGALVEVRAPGGVGGAGGVDAAWHIGAEAQRGWARQAQGQAFWHARPDDQPARLLHSRGLPAGQAFTRLFGPAATI